MTVSADVHRSTATEPRRVGPANSTCPAQASDPGAPSRPADRRVSVARSCMLVLTGSADGDADRTVGSAEPAPELVRLHDSATEWIRGGGTAEAFHRIVRGAVDDSFAEVVAGVEPGSATELLPALRRFVHAHEAVARAVSTGLARPLSLGAEGPVPALRSLATAVAEGRIEALPSGARIGTAYAVVALALVHPGPDEYCCALSVGETSADPGADTAGVLHRMRLVLLRKASILPALGVHGGTLLIPTDDGTDPAELIAELTAAAGVPILAAAVPAQHTEIAEAADTAHELLDLAQRLRYGPGLYLFRDLALEYQLTRPGPARAGLAARVAPLYDHPELLDTLLLYLRHRLRRQVTAQILELHRNTVDYRLRRIQELTGCDPVQQSGLWCLQSALIAHSYECGRRVSPPGRSPACRCAPPLAARGALHRPTVPGADLTQDAGKDAG